jgi:hypothetical protein
MSICNLRVPRGDLPQTVQVNLEFMNTCPGDQGLLKVAFFLLSQMKFTTEPTENAEIK